MSKLTDIIRREVKDLVSKQGGLMVTPAVVTAVQEDFLRADVKLLGNGAEIKGMLNKSPGKLTVGQTVTVAYETLPSSGVILIANGETDPLSEGGGWEVDTAGLLDEDNVHHWLADEELMLNIDAETKLLYGGHQRLVSVQGHACRWGTSTTLTSDDVDKFGSKLELDVQWREDASSDFVLRHMVFEMVVNTINTTTSQGVTYDSYTFGIIVSCYDPNSLSSPLWTQAFASPAVRSYGSIEGFIVPTTANISFNDTFSIAWSGTTKSVSTPYGYCVCGNLELYCGVYTNDTVTLNTWREGSNTRHVYASGYNKGGSYKCVPLESTAEKCFDQSLMTRSEPVTPNQGGGA